MTKAKVRNATPATRFTDYQYTGAQIQNTKKSKVYVFGNDEVCDDDVVEYEMSAVRSRKAPRQVEEDEQPTYFERELSEGDTLRSISLQYGCQVAEIKRINNMIQDQDFYAFKKIKVPLKKYSFLTEIVDKPNDRSLIVTASHGMAQKL
ncbi:hypothetical protein FSP39_020421 [Pinctada imbricata]|uniref:LysM domain-containing protein n=1 Tax=Pinctada imbricata TaxID=66713 RepID=A0AA88Y5H9_PINIB|nr:hypothetical protein FSP39_020421 [Pinctada imbricata]